MDKDIAQQIKEAEGHGYNIKDNRIYNDLLSSSFGKIEGEKVVIIYEFDAFHDCPISQGNLIQRVNLVKFLEENDIPYQEEVHTDRAEVISTSRRLFQNTVSSYARGLRGEALELEKLEERLKTMSIPF